MNGFGHEKPLFWRYIKATCSRPLSDPFQDGKMASKQINNQANSMFWGEKGRENVTLIARLRGSGRTNPFRPIGCANRLPLCLSLKNNVLFSLNEDPVKISRNLKNSPKLIPSRQNPKSAWLLRIIPRPEISPAPEISEKFKFFSNSPIISLTQRNRLLWSAYRTKGNIIMQDFLPLALIFIAILFTGLWYLSEDFF